MTSPAADNLDALIEEAERWRDGGQVRTASALIHDLAAALAERHHWGINPDLHAEVVARNERLEEALRAIRDDRFRYLDPGDVISDMRDVARAVLAEGEAQ